MTTQVVGALRPSLMLSALLVAGTLVAAPPQAAAEGRIVFTKMTVTKCEDMVGGCEWRLACQTGSEAEVEITSGTGGKAGRSVTLDKAMDVAKFPAELKCKLTEDDGLFSASWEPAGEVTLALPAGGNFKLDVGSPDQGFIRVEMIADSLEVLLPPPAPADPKSKKPAPNPVQFAGAFNAWDQGEAIFIGLDWTGFKAKVDELSGQRIKLMGMDTFVDGGKLYWSGIFRSSQEPVTLLKGEEWDTFLAQWKRMSNSGNRLVDFEVFQEGGKTKFAGLYRKGSDSYTFWVGQERKAILEKMKELEYSKGWRVNDLEAYRPGSQTLYAAAFRTAVDPREPWTALERAAFETKWNGSKGKAMVVDLETYKEGSKRLFDALVQTNGAGEVELGLDQAAFISRWRENLAKGLRLTDVETYRD